LGCKAYVAAQAFAPLPFFLPFRSVTLAVTFSEGGFSNFFSTASHLREVS
jgi:hypothetical protein